MNMWIPQHEPQSTRIDVKDDGWDQFTEALCRFLFGSVMDTLQQSHHDVPISDMDGWYSPSENDKDLDEDNVVPRYLVDHELNLSYVFTTLAHILSVDPDDFTPLMKKKILQVLLRSVLHPKGLQDAAKAIVDAISRDIRGSNNQFQNSC